MVRLLSIVFLLALALLPAAQAQAPTDPRITVSLDVKGVTTVPLGTAASIPIDVQIRTQYIFCQSPSTVTVNLEITDTGLPGVTGSIPASVTVPIKANVQGMGARTDSSGNTTARLAVTVVKTALPDHDHAFTVKATSASGLPSGCSAVSPTAPASSTESKDVAIKTGPALANTTMSGTGGAGSGTGSKKSFFVPIELQVGVLLAVGLLRRRL